MLRKTKNSWKFVYILAKQCSSHFNLTNIFDRKNFEILISLSKFETFTKTCCDTLYHMYKLFNPICRSSKNYWLDTLASYLYFQKKKWQWMYTTHLWPMRISPDMRCWLGSTTVCKLLIVKLKNYVLVRPIANSWICFSQVSKHIFNIREGQF